MAAALTGCASGGGDEGIAFTFTASSGELSEDGAPTSVGVVLHSGGGPLVSAVSVEVTDLLTGTATPGGDYVALGTTTLVFPVGATSGTVLELSIVPLVDDLVEGATETIALALGGASEGTAAGSYQAQLLDIDEAAVQFASVASGPLDEATGPYDVLVELLLDPGVSLGVPVSVAIQDQGAGTATSGQDYVAFPQQAVSFPPGSSDGALQPVQLGIQDDAVGEPQETIVLSLSNPSAGAQLGGQVLHQVSIPDDDGGVEASLSVSVGPSGLEAAVASGDQVDLGLGSLASPASLQVRVANQGVLPMDLSPPVLTGADADDFHIELQLGSTTTAAMMLGATHDMHTPMVQGATVPGLGTALTLDEFGLAELEAFDDVRLLGFPLPGHGEVTLELERMPLPIAADAVVSVDGVVQAGGLRELVGDLSVWRGSVLELADSRVILSLTDAGPSGFFELPGQPERFVHLDHGGARAGGQPGTARLLAEEEYLAFGGVRAPAECDGSLLAPGAAPESLELALAPTAELGVGSSLSTCELALETDYQLFQKFGTTQDTAAYVTQLIAAVSDQYVTDVQTSLSIAYLGLHSSPADPWTSQDTGGSPSDLLAEFRTAWSSTGWPVQADLAHFISGASLGGGVAYVNVLCSPSFAFGVSGSIGGSIDWGTWTGDPGHFTWDFVVVAHELGHNFGASHTHDYCPPIDHCSTNCDGSSTCSQGTLMSYCHGCGGLDNIDLRFHPVVANIMRGRVAASCLDSATLAGGDHLEWTVRFEPLGGPGAKAAELEFEHDAPNQPQPFRIGLAGQAQ